LTLNVKRSKEKSWIVQNRSSLFSKLELNWSNNLHKCL